MCRFIYIKMNASQNFQRTFSFFLQQPNETHLLSASPSPTVPAAGAVPVAQARHVAQRAAPAHLAGVAGGAGPEAADGVAQALQLPAGRVALGVDECRLAGQRVRRDAARGDELPGAGPLPLRCVLMCL